LSGIRVLDLTRVLAGPTARAPWPSTGADVLKISASHIAARDDQEYDTGHGKLSARLDLRQPQDLDTLKGLVREGDVFSQGYRPGTLGNRGCRPKNSQRYARLVYVSLCAFSHKGPWASRRGFDTVVQNVSGITTRQGELFPGAEPGPQFYPVSAIDYLTGYLMAFGAMVALARALAKAAAGSCASHWPRPAAGWSARRGARGRLKDRQKRSRPRIDRWSIESDTPAGAAPSRTHCPAVGNPAHWPAPRSRSDTTTGLARPRGVTPGRATPAQRLPCGFDVNLQSRK